MAPDTLLWNMARRRKQYQVAARINRAENLSAILAEVKKYEVVLLENVDALVHQAVTKCWFEYNIRLYIASNIRYTDSPCGRKRKGSDVCILRNIRCC